MFKNPLEEKAKEDNTYFGKLLYAIVYKEKRLQDRVKFECKNEKPKELEDGELEYLFNYELKIYNQLKLLYSNHIQDPEEYQKLMFYDIYTALCHMKEEMEKIIKEKEEEEI